jgi:hypothetical protein
MPSVQAPSSGFKAASKAIHSAEDLKAFLASDTAKDFVGFILALNAAVAGVCENDGGRGGGCVEGERVCSSRDQ